MARRWRRKPTVKPVFSAFIWGVLVGIGIDPGQMLFQTAVDEFGPYLQFAALIILVLAIYFTYNSILEGIKLSRKAYRVCGVLGVVAILAAFLAGFLIFTGERGVIILVAALATWLYAQHR